MQRIKQKSRTAQLIFFLLLAGHSIFGLNGPAWVLVGTSASYYYQTDQDYPGYNFKITSGNGMISNATKTFNVSAQLYTYRITYTAPGYSSFASISLFPERDSPIYGAIASTGISVSTRVTSVSLSPSAVAPRCSNGTDQTVFTATPVGDYAFFEWTISPANAAILATNNNQCTVKWKAAHIGPNATITVKAVDHFTTYATTSVTISTIETKTFTARLSGPSQVCEGQPISFSVYADPQPVTYKWWYDDNYTEPLSQDYDVHVPGSIVVPGSWYKVDVTPSSSIPCLTSYAMVSVQSNNPNHLPNFSIKPNVSVSAISMPNGAFTERCQNENLTTQFAATASNADNYTWSISPSNPANPAPTTHAGAITESGLVTWNPDFYGTAWITFRAQGCGPEAVAGKQIIVKKQPTVLPVNYPTELCASATGLVSIAGSEIGVTYKLLSRYGPTFPWRDEDERQRIPGTNSWNVWGSFRDHKIVATPNNDCQAVEFPIFSIALIPQTPITVSVQNGTVVNGTVYACEYSILTLTVAGGAVGTPYSWKADADAYCRDNPEEVPAQPWMKSEFCQPRLDPYRDPNGINDNISFQVWPFANWFPIYATGTDATCNAFIKSNQIKVIPSPDFYPLSIEADDELICQGSGATQFELHYDGQPVVSDWQLTALPKNNVTPSLGSTVLTKGPTSASIQWDPNFSGDVILNFSGVGCGEEKNLPKYLTVHKVLEDDENFVRSISASQPLQSPIDLFSNIHDVSKVNTITNYFDGLGRNVQNVSTKLSPTLQDIVQVKRYDNFGRESTSYLPYSKQSSTSYNSLALLQQELFYGNPPAGVSGDANPFSQTQYEPSPLNRVLKQGQTGATWQPADEDPYNLEDFTVKMRYNIASNQEIIQFTYSKSTHTVSADENGLVKYYPAGQLKANVVYDEENNQTIEYVDKEGRTICKKVQINNDGMPPAFASTYYVYDELGNLAIVLPPEAVNSALSQLTQN